MPRHTCNYNHHADLVDRLEAAARWQEQKIRHNWSRYQAPQLIDSDKPFDEAELFREAAQALKTIIRDIPP